ncbi:MAG TPA: nucleotidyl transferase AbiEii/AbiGii toxin family protein [Candidatus Pacearchaeota archaeon]|nr:nucleotidyl transferase AbiEii/AbiGii toxin family protein [Candidatus Pacearchaeota archaeon]HPR80123.1 nucleotidyl transferase AbiEii/AbiGii toxin family protein [Candidatus Pacearchaeota archaeon]
MLNKEKHQLIMGQILKDIYTDISIASLLGFKGGTCAYFFYNLPRFSVDLDFDIFSYDENDQTEVFEKVVKILEKYGTVKDKHIKKFTIFVLLSYGEADLNIKIEINTRRLIENVKDKYELKEYLGISMLVAKKEYLFAGKLSALTLRTTTAMRDVYDIYYFTKNNWDIDNEIVKSITGVETKKQLKNCLDIIEKIKSNEIMTGLGELVNEKEKKWIKSSLKNETIFMLKNYIASIK